MLYQKHPDENKNIEKVRVVRFGSKALNHWQRSYGPTKLELLGVVTSVTDCSSYLRGNEFIVECDHKALRPLIEKQLKGAIYDRWLAILQQYNFEIRYKPAAQMQVPDALSRCIGSDVSGENSSPAEDDLFFPYVQETTGQISISNPVENNTQTLNFIDFETEETDLDAGYTADTEYEYISPKLSENHCISTVFTLPKCSPIEQTEDEANRIELEFFDSPCEDTTALLKPTLQQKCKHSDDAQDVAKVEIECITEDQCFALNYIDNISMLKPLEAIDGTYLMNESTHNCDTQDNVLHEFDPLKVKTQDEQLNDEIDCNSALNLHEREWLKFTNASNLNDISVNAVQKILLGEKSDNELTNESQKDNDTSTEDDTSIENKPVPIVSSDDELVKRSIELFKRSDFSPDSVKELQRNDVNLRQIIDYLENQVLPHLQRDARRLILRSADYLLMNNLLFHNRNAKCKRTRDHKPKYQLALPKILIRPIMEIFHDSPMGGHGGIQNTIDLISEHFYFDKLPSLVTEYVKSCHDCQSRKMTKAHTKTGIISYRTPSGPFQIWQVDLYGPLPTSQRSYTHILSAIDMFSKFVYNVPIPNCDAMTVSYALFDMFCQFGVCDTIISDNGSEFISNCTKEVCKLLEIRQNFTPSMIHHCLGACERTHRTLAERLTPYIQKGTQWDSVLPAITFSMNASINSSTKYSPYEIIYGTRPKFPLCLSHQTDFSTLPDDYRDYVEKQAKKLDIIREEIRTNAQRSGELMMDRYNKKTNPLYLSVGDYVYMLKDPSGPGRKFQPKYSGPFITKIAHVRAPTKSDYFLSKVHTAEINRESDDPSTDSDSEHTEAIPPLPQTQPVVRRSTRTRKRPIRFQLSTLDTNSSDEFTTQSDTYYKVKRILSQRKINGKTEYRVQFKGEPAQNALWIPFEQLNEHTKKMVQSKPPPCAN
ncbi:unnamed protein product [Mytilus edulis]|uniref:Integrase catalytic domain-containing protein n=1 Tax=Mytilus edulis TaxID=6550 RepID=A0A8S3UB99_MYTED|nr:unnamed protein product [Mytilus edulis]